MLCWMGPSWEKYEKRTFVTNSDLITEPVKYEQVPTIEDYERKAFKAGQDSICGRCGDMDCYHNKNPHSFEEYKKSEGYPK